MKAGGLRGTLVRRSDTHRPSIGYPANDQSRPNHAVQQQIARSLHRTFNFVEEQTQDRAVTAKAKAVEI